MSQDYYELLGVSRTASADDLKKAFRKLAMQHHPDRNKDDKEAEKRFKTINHAYDILKDPEKRAAYDRYGPAAFEGGTGPGGPGGPFGGGAQGFDFGSVFGDIFEEIGSGRAEVVTGNIDHVDEAGIVLESGERVDASAHWVKPM